MSNPPLTPRHPLADVQRGRLGAPDPATPGVTLTARARGTVLHLLAAPVSSCAPDDLTALLGLPDLSLRAAGPNQWLLVGDRALPTDELAALASRLADKVAVIDQSHGRVRVTVSGPSVCDLLAKGLALDLSAAAFPVGQSAQCLYGHISLHLTRAAADSFDLLVFRGFAESLWDLLCEMGLEFGLQATLQTG